MEETEAPRLYLARHGLTQANLDRVHAGLREVPLLPRGREQARELAERARGLDLDEVWSSPLARARETAETVAVLLGVPLHTDDELREMEAGPWQGFSDDEIARRFPDLFQRWQDDPASFRLDGRETLDDVRRRVVAALERIRARGGTALVVTHAAAIRLARVHYAGEELNRFASFTPEHCALLELTRNGDGQCRLAAADAEQEPS